MKQLCINIPDPFHPLARFKRKMQSMLLNLNINRISARICSAILRAPPPQIFIDWFVCFDYSMPLIASLISCLVVQPFPQVPKRLWITREFVSTLPMGNYINSKFPIFFQDDSLEDVVLALYLINCRYVKKEKCFHYHYVSTIPGSPTHPLAGPKSSNKNLQIHFSLYFSSLNRFSQHQSKHCIVRI